MGAASGAHSARALVAYYYDPAGRPVTQRAPLAPCAPATRVARRAQTPASPTPALFNDQNFRPELRRLAEMREGRSVG